MVKDVKSKGPEGPGQLREESTWAGLPFSWIQGDVPGLDLI